VIINRGRSGHCAEPSQELVAAHSSKPGIGNDHEELFVRQQIEPLFGRLDGTHVIILIREHRLKDKRIFFSSSTTRTGGRWHSWRANVAME